MKYLKLFENWNVKFQIGSIESLSKLLIKYNISIDDWNKGEAKSIENLYNEIVKDDCTLIVENDKLVRSVEFVGITIYYKNSNLYILKEDEQIFIDGRVRKRNMLSSVAEKMMLGENPIKSAIRGIKEELNVDISEDQLEVENKSYSKEKSSMSYPGLNTKYIGHDFICYFTDEQYDENGYIEKQKDKSTYFKWNLIQNDI